MMTYTRQGAYIVVHIEATPFFARTLRERGWVGRYVDPRKVAP